MLSLRAKYALKALFALAEVRDETPMQTREIARLTGAPQHFMESIVFDLKKRGFVTAQRGRSGGYRLGRPATEISFAEVIRAVDGPIALVPCASKNFYAPCPDCQDVAACQLRRTLQAARDAAASVLENATLAQPMPAALLAV